MFLYLKKFACIKFEYRNLGIFRMLWVYNVKMMHTKRWICETNVRLILDLNNFQNVKAETTLQLDTKYVE